MQHTVAAPANRFFDHCIHALCAVSERSHKHGQVNAGDGLDAPGDKQLADEADAIEATESSRWNQVKLVL